jgi:hypothetical protein
LNIILKLLLLIGVIALGNFLTQSIVSELDYDITPVNEFTVHRIIMISMIAYLILMAIPFVPGAEIGLAVMLILGPKIVPLVYLCTVASLSLSFILGRIIPEQMLVRFLHDLRLQKASQFLDRLRYLDSEQRLNLILSSTPKRLTPTLLKHRYIALAFSINIPGNIIIGGGGGIALIAGISRLFSVPLFLLTIVIAVSPVPLLLIIFGESFIKGIL